MLYGLYYYVTIETTSKSLQLSLFHDFFILTPLLLVINSCSTKNTNLQVEYRTRATLLIIIFNDSSEVTKAANLKAIEKPREEGREKRKPPPPPPLFWHDNPTSISPLESFLTLPNSLSFNFLTVIVRTAKYVKHACFDG